MIIPTPVKYRRHRRYELRATAQPAPPPGPLTLVSANYTEGVEVTMSFNRAIDISGFEYGLVRLDYGDFGFTYIGLGPPELIDPMTVWLPMTAIDDYSGSGVLLTVPGDSGIVAVDDGSQWSGVDELELPFP